MSEGPADRLRELLGVTWVRSRVLAHLAPGLPAEALMAASYAARAIEFQDPGGRRLAEPALVAVATRALELAEPAGPLAVDWEVLAYVPDELLPRAVALARAVEDPYALVALAPRTARAGHADLALALLEEAARMAGDPFAVRYALEEIAPSLGDAQAGRALELALAMPYPSAWLGTVAALAPSLSPEQAERALEAVARLDSEDRLAVLAALVPRLGPERRIAAGLDLLATLAGLPPATVLRVATTLAEGLPQAERTDAIRLAFDAARAPVDDPSEGLSMDDLIRLAAIGPTQAVVGRTALKRLLALAPSLQAPLALRLAAVLPPGEPRTDALALAADRARAADEPWRVLADLAELVPEAERADAERDAVAATYSIPGDAERAAAIAAVYERFPHLAPQPSPGPGGYGPTVMETADAIVAAIPPGDRAAVLSEAFYAHAGAPPMAGPPAEAAPAPSDAPEAGLLEPEPLPEDEAFAEPELEGPPDLPEMLPEDPVAAEPPPSPPARPPQEPPLPPPPPARLPQEPPPPPPPPARPPQEPPPSPPPRAMPPHAPATPPPQGPPLPPGEEPPRRPVVNTGFAKPEAPDDPLPPWRPLAPRRTYLFWLEVGEELARSIEAHAVSLPRDLPEGARVTVAVSAVSEGVAVEAATGELEVHANGSAAVSRHAASVDSARPSRLFFRVRVTASRGEVALRCTIYRRQVVVQSRLIRARLGGRLERALPRSTPALVSTLDYVLARTLDPPLLAHVPEHRVSLMVNGDGATHALQIMAADGGAPEVHAATFESGELQDLVTQTRGALRRAAWDTEDAWEEGREYRYGGPPDPERLEGDLVTMAVRGYRFYDACINRLAGGYAAVAKLEAMLRPPGRIQIANRRQASLILPAAMFYDQPLDTGLGTLGLCPEFRAALDAGTPLESTRCFAGDCPTHGDLDVVCPSGFWGFRHFLGLPLSLGEEPTDEAAVFEDIAVDGRPEVSLAVSTDPMFVGRADHEARLRALAPDLTWHYADTRDETLRLLRESPSHVVYFYCHGGLTTTNVPYVQVGPTGARGITSDNLRALRIRWSRPRPLVFINGCHTTALNPEQALNFPTGLIENAAAAGVIGTEITNFEPLASAFAEDCLRRFLGGEAIGEAVRGARLTLLARGNPLGLIYVPFVLPSVRLVRA